MRRCGLLVVALLVAIPGGMAKATAAVTAPPGMASSGSIGGEVGEVDGGPTLDSFREDSPPFPAAWTAGDTASNPESGQAQASHTFSVTSGSTTTTAVTSGNVAVQYSLPARRVTSDSGYTARFELSEPMQYSATGTLTSSGQTSSGLFCCSAARARLEPDIFDQDVQNGQSAGVAAGGILQPGDYSLFVFASAGIGFGAAIAPDVSGGATFQLRFELSPPGPPPPPNPILVQGGPENSNLNLQVDTTPSGGVKYTFNDPAPLQINDSRCQAGPPKTCEVPLAAAVEIDFGAGDDLMTVSGNVPFGQLTVNGGLGDDTLVASPIARGGPGADTINAGNCGAGQCVLDGGDDDDFLTGGPGDDLLLPGEDADPRVRGEGGSDTVDYSSASSGVLIDLVVQEVDEDGGAFIDQLSSIENAIGSSHGDSLIGDAGTNRLDGGGGNDGLDGLDGADELIGGGGTTDQVGYGNHTTPVRVTLGDGLANDGSANEGDRVTEIEQVLGSDQDDELIGTDGSNLLEGMGGDDILSPLEGTDTADGGVGSDTVDYAAATAAVKVSLFADSADEDAGTTDQLPAVENAVGSAFDDSLFGDDDPVLPNRLDGREGDDSLFGFRGPDELIGGPDIDKVSYFTNSTGVTVNLANSASDSGSPGENDHLFEVENVEGSEHNDALSGNNDANQLEGLGGDDGLFSLGGNDVLLGGEGEDFVDGQDGDDTVDGGEGPDLVSGGRGEDTLLYSDRTVGVVVDLGSGTGGGGQGEPGEGDAVDRDFENLIGGDGNDVLTGNTGPNRLEGGFGADTIRAQDGGVRDFVFCGPGADLAEADQVDDVSVDCEGVTFPGAPPPPPPAANTPAGVNVSVTPVDATTLTFPVTVTFAAVTTPGNSLVFSSQSGPIVPAGFQLGTPPVYYFISTNAAIVSPITVCIDMTGITFPTQPPALFHFDQVTGTWVDITMRPVSPPKICGQSATLSPFAVLSPKRTVRSARCVVPNVKGKSLAAARKAIRRGSCNVGRVRRVYSPKVRVGRVISQRPKPRTRLAHGAKVNLTLSRGKRRK